MCELFLTSHQGEDYTEHLENQNCKHHEKTDLLALPRIHRAHELLCCHFAVVELQNVEALKVNCLLMNVQAQEIVLRQVPQYQVEPLRELLPPAVVALASG
jgi:hypothetical protein